MVSILNKINLKNLPNIYDSLYPNKNGEVFIKLPRFSGHKPIKDKLNPDFYTIIIKKYENDFNGMIVNGMSRYQWHVADQLANALADRPHTLSTGRQSLATLEAMHKIINQRESCLQKN